MLAIPGYYSRETEFVGGLTGACGPNALASAVSRSRQRYVGTLDVYRVMRAHGLCNANGVSAISGLHAAAPLLGTPVAGYQPWTGNEWNWASFVRTHLAAGHPVVIEVSRGQALRDAITGKGENAVGLRYHFIAVIGSDSAGRYLCCDGDNYAVGNVLQTYTPATLAAAAPCAALAIAQVAKIVMPAAETKPVAPPPPPPAPWEPVKARDGSTWYEQRATGKRLGGGLYAALHAAHLDTLPLLSNEVQVAATETAVAIGPLSSLRFLGWDHSAHTLVTPNAGAIAAGYLASLPAAE